MSEPKHLTIKEVNILYDEIVQVRAALAEKERELKELAEARDYLKRELSDSNKRIAALTAENKELKEEIAYQDVMLNPGEYIREQKRDGFVICVLREDLWDIRSKKDAEKEKQRISTLQGQIENWKDSAAQFLRNQKYYAGLLDEVAKHLGNDVFISDDGSVQDEPLRAKIPELVAALKAEIKVLNHEQFEMSQVIHEFTKQQAEHTEDRGND
ncbi:MAG: hypothetical protein WC637_00205 [Victivallales bacterium]